MRYDQFKKLGIHTRLQQVINKSGGYDIYTAALYLIEKYNLKNKDIALEMARNENIEEEIKKFGLDAIIKLTEKSIRLKEINYRNMVYKLKHVLRGV